MGPPSERDLADIGPGLVRWFRERHGVRSATLMSIERPSAGYSSDTVLVDLAVGDTGVGRTESIVIRIAPPVPGTFLDYDLRAQAGAQAAAARVGLPVADPAMEPDVSWIGAPFMVMQRVAGHIISDFPLTDDWLGSLDDDGRSAVHATFIDTLATIHRAGTGDLDGVPHRDNEAELDHWAEYLEWSSGGSPVATLVDALEWCRDNRPANESEPVLLWGDARLGNLILTDALEVAAVLDWDMAFVGAPEHDLAWFNALDLTTFSIFGTRPSGFPDRDGTIDAYRRSSGRTVDDMEWYETLAMLRSTAILTRISYLRRDAGEQPMLPIDDNPLLDLLRARMS